MANLCASSAVNAVVTEALKAYANHACSGVLQLSVWTNVYNAASACKIILKKIGSELGISRILLLKVF